MATTAREWTCLTWNIQGSKHTDLGRLRDVILAESPDIVTLQEIRRSQADTLADHLQMSHHWSLKHQPLFPLFPDRAEGACILTPHRLSDTGEQRVSYSDSIRSYKRRILQWATVARDDASGYRIYNVHLSPHDLRTERLGEVRRIADLVEAHGDAPPAVLSGDFNDADEPDLIASLPGIEVMASPPSNPADAPTQALDHVLVPAGATGVAMTVPGGGEDWAALSDHLPVTVRFSLDWVSSGFAG